MKYSALAAAALAVACANPLEVDLFAVDVVGDVVLSPTRPADFTVRVTNMGDERVVWGTGSSSCQLTLEVIDDALRHRIDHRACTADLVEHGLDPGQVRSETFTWDGRVVVNGELTPLPPGPYRLVGSAGTRAESELVRVTVQPPALP